MGPHEPAVKLISVAAASDENCAVGDLFAWRSEEVDIESSDDNVDNCWMGSDANGRLPSPHERLSRERPIVLLVRDGSRPGSK